MNNFYVYVLPRSEANLLFKMHVSAKSQVWNLSTLFMQRDAFIIILTCCIDSKHLCLSI